MSQAASPVKPELYTPTDIEKAADLWSANCVPINAGLWLSKQAWEIEVMNEIVKANKRADGWRLRSGLEVMP